ncbi:MAG: hypoxanthine phosphoribosyltransferase [bacterium]
MKLIDKINFKMAIDARTIHNKVEQMGKKISNDFREKEFVLIGILKGSVCFLADIMRSIEVPYTLDFIGVSTYKEGTTSSGRVEITYDLHSDFKGKELLIVEDITDTGITLDYLIGQLKEKGAISISIATLLNKKERRKVDIEPNYIGFNVENKFYVGYGLDYKGMFRHLPFLAILDETPPEIL